MKDNKICKGSYIPYDIEKDEFEIPNVTYDYIRRFGIELDNKGNRALNPRHIIMNNTQILINRSFFKRDLPLLRALEKLPIEGTEDVLRMAFDAIWCFMGKINFVDWGSKDYILIDDLDSVDVSSKPSKFMRKHHG